jgi:hypothetical protein
VCVCVGGGGVIEGRDKSGAAGGGGLQVPLDQQLPPQPPQPPAHEVTLSLSAARGERVARTRALPPAAQQGAGAASGAAHRPAWDAAKGVGGCKRF